MVIGSRGPPKSCRRVHSRKFSQHTHGLNSKLGGMAVINTPSAAKAKKVERRMRSAHRILDPPRPPRLDLDGLCALAVMTKAPRRGEVKTRLTPPLRPAEAAELNRCFLRDTTAAIAQASGNIARGIAVYTPKGAEADYTDILPRSFALLLQRGGSFGERLIAAAYDLFRVGFDSVCLIDSDSPDRKSTRLNSSHVSES